MKVYFFRHQAAGVLYDFPFAEQPSDSQLEALARRCAAVHGACHPKSPDVPYWTRIEERDVVAAADAIAPPGPSAGGVLSAAGMGEFIVSGTGTVKPPR